MEKRWKAYSCDIHAREMCVTYGAKKATYLKRMQSGLSIFSNSFLSPQSKTVMLLPISLTTRVVPIFVSLRGSKDRDSLAPSIIT